MVEQKGTNNNAGFPVINAKKDCQSNPRPKGQTEITIKHLCEKLVAVDLHPFDNAPLRNKVNPNAATKATTTV